MMPRMPAPASIDADIELRNHCDRWLNGHRPLRSMRESLLALADLPEAALPLDVYGQGPALQALEAEVAALLGKPAARFMHKGVAAQLAALRVHCGAGDGPVALHPQSHIAIDEAEAFEKLMGLRGLRVGGTDRPSNIEDLMAEPEHPAVVTVELPLRRGVYVLPEWEDLVILSNWCRTVGVPPTRSMCPSTRAWAAWPAACWPVAMTSSPRWRPGRPAWPATSSRCTPSC